MIHAHVNNAKNLETFNSMSKNCVNNFTLNVNKKNVIKNETNLKSQ